MITRIINILFMMALCTATVGSAFAAKNTITVGTNVSEWSSSTPPDPAAGVFPIGGAGQINGNFVVVERDGIQIGLRATDRKDGLLPVTASGRKTGVYMACTGEDQGETDRAEWNYDWHLDLRGTGTTLADYHFTLNQTFSPTLFGSTGPLDLSFPQFANGILDTAILYQSSQNPTFGNDTFDEFAEGTYNLALKLRPKDSGSPLTAHIRVIVSDCF